jgi:hypothetical protein
MIATGWSIHLVLTQLRVWKRGSRLSCKLQGPATTEQAQVRYPSSSRTAPHFVMAVALRLSSDRRGGYYFGGGAKMQMTRAAWLLEGFS